MKTGKVSISPAYVLPILLFIVITFGAQTSGCARKPAAAAPEPGNAPAVANDAVNINTATAEDLARLPQIGEHYAKKIVEYRAAHGPFRRPEHLMLVEGVSDKKFRVIREFIKTE